MLVTDNAYPQFYAFPTPDSCAYLIAEPGARPVFRYADRRGGEIKWSLWRGPNEEAFLSTLSANNSPCRDTTLPDHFTQPMLEFYRVHKGKPACW